MWNNEDNKNKLTVHCVKWALKLQLFHLAFHPEWDLYYSCYITGFITHQSATCNISFLGNYKNKFLTIFFFLKCYLIGTNTEKT